MTEAAAGLTSAEARERLARYGPNELAPPRRFEALREIISFLANPLVLILLGASPVSALLGQPFSAGVIAVMVALNFAQAYNSQRAGRRLRGRVGQMATVMRDGTFRATPVRDVVLDDVVRLTAGDLVPADARLVTAKDLFLNEAALTGSRHAGMAW
jgi:Mg2+-importing ATPase